MTAHRRGIRLVVLVLGAVAAGCGTDCTPASDSPRRNVVLVTVDTLRADHLGCYGNPSVRTPEIDRFARGGALFERSYAAANTTVPSHLTLLTSLPLSAHGVLTNAGRLTRPVVALPALFAQAGYRTGAVVSAKHLGPEFALGAALSHLDVYAVPRRLSVPAPAEDTNDRAFEWLRRVCRDPFFLWVHYWDPHMPYGPPPPFDTAYYDGDETDARHHSMDDATLAWALYERPRLRQLLAERVTEVRALERALGVDWPKLRTLIYEPVDLDTYVRDPAAAGRARQDLEKLAAFARARVPLRADLSRWLAGVRDLRYPRARYAGEVSYVDREIGRLRAELERMGVAERTAVVITADHGESLGEHGIYFDHAGLYEDTLRVPLIVWAPGVVPAGRHREIARGLDVAPTLLALAGLSVPSSMQGRPLFDRGASDEAVAESAGQRQVMIVDGRWKLIRTLRSFHYVPAFARAAGTVELYDLERDPGEERDMATVRADMVNTLVQRLDGWLMAHPRVADGDGDAASGANEPSGRLRALGYVE
jgi:arylsulfatase A-like enzyme